MANFLFSEAEAPYLYRILTPLLVFLLPVDPIIGFIIINISGLYATSIIFFYFLKKLGFNFKSSLTGVMFFLLNPITIFLIQAIYYVDILLLFFFLLAFYALLCKNDVLFMFSVSIGVLNKEAILIILILFFLHKKKDKKIFNTVILTLLISLPPIAVFFIIRFIIGFNSNYFSLEMIFYVLSTHIQNFQSISLFLHPFLIYQVFGILWLISLLNVKKIDNSLLKSSLFLLPFIFLQIIIATNYGRLLFLAFPIIIPISIYMFKDEGLRKNTLLFTLIIAIILFIFHIIGTINFYDPSISIMKDFKSYAYWIFLSILSEFFAISILLYLLLRKKNKNSC